MNNGRVSALVFDPAYFGLEVGALLLMPMWWGDQRRLVGLPVAEILASLVAVSIFAALSQDLWILGLSARGRTGPYARRASGDFAGGRTEISRFWNFHKNYHNQRIFLKNY